MGRLGFYFAHLFVLAYCAVLLGGFIVQFGKLSTTVIWIFGVIIVANLIVVFLEEGFHFALPDAPDRYQLFYDLGIAK